MNNDVVGYPESIKKSLLKLVHRMIAQITSNLLMFIPILVIIIPVFCAMYIDPHMILFERAISLFMSVEISGIYVHKINMFIFHAYVRDCS